MTLDNTYQTLREASESIALVGGAIMALAYGIRRIYRTAHNVQLLVERSDATQKFIAEQTLHNAKRDAETAELARDVADIVREIRPNGGSSIKDQVNKIATEVAVLKQWKQDQK